MEVVLDRVTEFAERYVPTPEGREALRALLGELVVVVAAPVSLSSLSLGGPGVGPSDPTVVRAPSADTFAPDLGVTGPALPTDRDDVGPYDDLGPIGRGGMGEVRRVRDRDLNRVIAMKVIRKELVGNAGIVARFVEEAQCTAQLQHPGIVPVYEIGRLPDGRLYFTMREVHGRTLRDVIRDVHRVSRGEWGATADGWTFRRLIDAFHAACEAVAYAHARGVVHRDLKPDNVMVGPFGEVLVMDWGLAKIRGRPEAAEAVVTDRSRKATDTHAGTIAGTPAYMAPEQARGEVARIDAHTDVYALGAVLYHLLDGRPPYRGKARDVVAKVLAGPPPPPGSDDGPPPPSDLLGVCAKAMARDPADRYPDAAALAEDVAAWRDGARKREQALVLVTRADGLADRVAELRAQAARLRGEAAAILDEIGSWEPEDRKEPGWRLQDEAHRLDRDADLADLEGVQALRAALEIAPALPEAHAVLAERARAEQQAAEDRRDDAAAARAEAVLRTHVDALPPGHPSRVACRAWLRGDGALTLVTEPACEVELLRYEVRGRRLVPVPFRRLGRTPLSAVSLPRGSYLAVLRAAGRAEVRYPVAIGRQEHWDGVPPGSSEPFPVPLPGAGELAADEVYVPAGWASIGGDPLATEALPKQRVWVDGFVMRRFPVTNADYVAFLDGLVAAGREEDALAWVPRERGHGQDKRAGMIYGRDAAGRFVLVPDHDGDVWMPDYPVVLVDHACASAYAREEAAATGLPWRLPAEIEREKATRGTDGRAFPWGDFHDPSWACGRHSHERRNAPASIARYPVDESPYGARHVAGNSRDWCLDAWGVPVVDGGRARIVPGEPEATRRFAIRGGSWFGLEPVARAAARWGLTSAARTGDVGIRLARSYTG